MQISIEDLMKPRYKVIADYPLSKMYFNVGDILYWNEQFESYRIDEKKVSMNKDTIESYPHLFKLLAWYEDREESQMPQFIKLRKEHYDDYFSHTRKARWKVYKWDNGFAQIDEENEYDLIDNREFHFESATESEYLSYINSKK